MDFVLNREGRVVMEWLLETPVRGDRVRARIEAIRRASPTAAVSRLAVYLRELAEDALPELDGVASELIALSLFRVDFTILARAMIYELCGELQHPGQVDVARRGPLSPKGDDIRIGGQVNAVPVCAGHAPLQARGSGARGRARRSSHV